MRQDILHGLSTSLQQLVGEIENAAGFEIQINHRSERTEYVSDAGDSSVGAIPHKDRAVIEYDNKLSDITENDYAHELLHLHRWYVQGVPHLVSSKKADGVAISAIDNQLEHVIIYGRQLEISPTFAATFQQENKEVWTGAYPWGVSGRDLKFYSVAKFLVTKLYGDDEANKAMRSALSKDQILFRTRKAAEAVQKHLHDKRQYVKTILDYAEIPYVNFSLRRYYPKEFRSEDNPI